MFLVLFLMFYKTMGFIKHKKNTLRIEYILILEKFSLK